MSDDVRLATGQTVRLEDGAVRVVASPPHEARHHYRMTLAHPEGSGLPTVASAATYAPLLPFLAQLEAIGYVLLDITRAEGVQR